MVTIEQLQTYDFDEIKNKCFGFIYITRNKLNGTLYLGQHTAWNENYLGSGILIVKAVKKYGEENFERIIIDVADNQAELDDLETMYINEFFGYCIAKSKKWYNIKDGGQHGGSTFAGKTYEEMKEIKKKMRENQAWKGKHLSDEAKKKISEKNAKYWKGKYKGENNPRAKRIVLYQPKINEIVGVWTTRKECAEWLYNLEGINFGSCNTYLGNQLKNRHVGISKKYPALNKVKAYYYDDFIKLFGEEKLDQFTL